MSTEVGFRPTTTCSILDTSPENLVDEFGDPLDNETVSASGIPISIIHQTTRQFLPSENRTTVIHNVVGRMRASVTVKATSRIKDENTGHIYMIEGLIHPQDPFGSSVIRLELRHINSGGTAY